MTAPTPLYLTLLYLTVLMAVLLLVQPYSWRYDESQMELYPAPVSYFRQTFPQHRTAFRARPTGEIPRVAAGDRWIPIDQEHR
jgi:hypothetical protein